MKRTKHNAKRPKHKQRATIEELRRVIERPANGVRSPGPRPSSAKPRGPRRERTSVAADPAAIEALPPNGRRQQFAVEGIENLYVRKEPSGLRAFHALRRVHGRWAGYKLGAVGPLTLPEAIIACRCQVLRWRIEELEAELQEVRGNADA